MGVTEQDFSQLSMPDTDPMFILADPDRAFELSNYPNKGVGLMRMEFAISNSIKIHPLALCEPEKSLIRHRPNIGINERI
jgi:pyruvate,water dikinase